MDENNLIKYIKGEGNSIENARVEEWINASSANRRKYNQLQNIWTISGLNTPVKEVNVEREIAQILKKTKQPNKLLRWWPKVAAILITASIIAGVSYWSGKQSNSVDKQLFVVTTDVGETTSITLPDGSKVKLNSKSKLTYGTDFNNDNRTLKLQGEAFFDVAKNKKLPFVVNTSYLNVTALGTRFNVMAYADDCCIETTLEEGRVKVVTSKDKKPYFLTPGTKIIYDKRKRSLVKKAVNTKLFTSWKDGLLVFKDESLGAIAAKLERLYDVKFQFEKRDAYNYRYNGDFEKTQSLEDIMRIISVPTGFEYEIKGKVVIVK
jgi:ferric-dicitrate binding protein FerR (iron transport regulator)